MISNEQYTRKVIPFIDKSYFQDNIEKVVVEEILKFFNEYNKLPTKEILGISVSNRTDISDEVNNKTQDYILELKADSGTDSDWLIDSTEKFVKQRALFNGILESMGIIQGEDKNRSVDAIPGLLQQALGISFDSSIGHDYLDDAEERWEYYHTQEGNRIPFRLSIFNKITKGGLKTKTLNAVTAGCVHPETKVKIKVENSKEMEVSIKGIEELLNSGYEVEVNSPDGFVPVNYFVDKGEWEEYVLTTENGIQVRVNENHLFETIDGWTFAKDMLDGKIYSVLTENGYKSCTVEKTGKMIPIVDINVDHENHRYYTNGVSSHNTGVGKTIFMCDFAAAALLQGLNVLYITMEMPEEEISARIDANLMNITMDDVQDIDKLTFVNKINKIKDKTKGKLIVKEYPSGSVHAGHFRALMQELRTKLDFKPDLLVVDYLGICASQRLKANHVNTNSYLKSVASELRALAQEQEIPCLTGVQVNREGQVSTDLDITNIAESIGITNELDLFFAIISTDDLAQLNQLMVKQLKNRYNDINYYTKFVIGIERPKMKLYDVENSAQDISGKGNHDDKPIFDKSKFGARDSGGFSEFKF